MRFNDKPRGSTVVLNLLIANILVFILQQISAHLDVSLLYQYLPLYSLETGLFRPWQLLTYGFMHDPGGIMHILFNMIVLWMFGRILAADLGEKRFLIYFLCCIVGGGLVQLLIAPFFGPFNVVLGASGGTMGLLLAFGWRYPTLEIMLLFPPIPVKARNLVIFLALFDVVGGIGGGPFGIAHFAHIGGLLSGLLLMAYWRGKLPLKPKEMLP
jgi:membrane associated rhomboid family serine protease|tara:strand:+ start:91840 stop:92478 length:639 start_codon:yes stop_codon:yes gene_type:complete